MSQKTEGKQIAPCCDDKNGKLCCGKDAKCMKDDKAARCSDCTKDSKDKVASSCCGSDCSKNCEKNCCSGKTEKASRSWCRKTLQT